jgi:hypothetical protein
MGRTKTIRTMTSPAVPNTTRSVMVQL